MPYDNDMLQSAHRHSSNHRAEIERSPISGCFFCRRTCTPAQIKEWVDDDTTAFCPRCGIDSLIGSASGYPVDKPAFLGAMRRRWFGSAQ